ncbi:maleylpyruvate isomerase family mycothiol-dependent enzyme [Streptomyces sp. ISL-100]|uniref:maleylpyruvate isomerase family mycothiol-dependent enzyme n=1 Tax=Streptomyces sp. ISL-100 TaxID=2819173 RepID=UPI001BEAC5CD|nr:maleylpyruvate isomerase family mycothiol-dependent enzyme [Streptomyces sp. ISL-100]MBT2397259.1 maleylpyruvate isomerase family mycothiol-dependent enzyme [Streptomyces sp. ISL-100]
MSSAAQKRPRPRPRRYDAGKIRAAVLAQFGNVQDAVRDLTPAQLALPTHLGDWTVRDLAAHVTMAVGAVSRHLEQPAPPKQEVPLLDWTFTTAARAAQISDDTKSIAESAPDLDALYEQTRARLAELLPTAPDDRLLATRVGAMRLDDYLVTRTVELIVHTDDLNHAAGLAVPYDRQALAACTRLLADALAVKAPGGSVEVRVPPYAVVQCVEGPRHTRGTPPNVVETDPLTWIRLATGRTDWDTAVDDAKVSASGERAHLAGLLPILG